jgi:cbb3-type cytochrome oxidase maturation protein
VKILLHHQNNAFKNPRRKMEAILILLIISLLVAGAFLIAFLVSIRIGQFDDDYTPSVRMLFDDEINLPKDPNTQSNDGN